MVKAGYRGAWHRLLVAVGVASAAAAERELQEAEAQARKTVNQSEAHRRSLRVLSFEQPWLPVALVDSAPLYPRPNLRDMDHFLALLEQSPSADHTLQPNAWLENLCQMLHTTEAPVWLIGIPRTGKTLLAEAITEACKERGVNTEIVECQLAPAKIPRNVHVVAFKQGTLDSALILSNAIGRILTADELLNMPRWQVAYRISAALDTEPANYGYVNVQELLAPWKVSS